MRKRLRQWLALPASDRGTLIAMMLALPLVSLGLRLLGYGRTRAWVERLSRPTPGTQPPDDGIARGQRLARLAAIAGRHGPVTATCLRQSLLLYALLRRAGHAPRLVIGARRAAGTLDAHAWIELEGVALGQARLVHAAFPDLDLAEHGRA